MTPEERKALEVRLKAMDLSELCGMTRSLALGLWSTLELFFTSGQVFERAQRLEACTAELVLRVG